MNTPLQEIVDEIAETCPDYYELLRGLAYCTRPRHIVELGTGTGVSADGMMGVLPPESTLATINWPNPPSGDDVGRELVRWSTDKRLTQILGDTRESAKLVPDEINLLFIDSTHDYDTILLEWVLYSQKLADGALVCVDDLDFPGGGVRQFWDELQYEKVEVKRLSPYGFGILRFRKAEQV